MNTRMFFVTSMFLLLKPQASPIGSTAIFVMPEINVIKTEVEKIKSECVTLTKKSTDLSQLQIEKFDSIPSEQEVMDVMIEIGIKFPEIVIKQIKLESSWFKSSLAKSANNLLGMGANSRPFSIGKIWTSDMGGSYKAVYKSWIACLLDYKEWQTSSQRKRELLAQCQSNVDYVNFLKKIGYATDPNYSKLLLSQ